MRIKKEIFDLMFKGKTCILMKTSNGSNKYYIVGESVPGTRHLSIGYGSMITGSGTFRNTQKNKTVVVSEKIKKGYHQIKLSDFLPIGMNRGLFFHNDIDQTRMEMNSNKNKPPKFNEKIRKSFIERISIYEA